MCQNNSYCTARNPLVVIVKCFAAEGLELVEVHFFSALLKFEILATKNSIKPSRTLVNNRNVLEIEEINVQ